MDLHSSALSVQPPMNFKANGEVSKMRNHRGNMPSLPQTKYCPLCPAKFTRTTHLNRHLRSHTNERSHRCDSCKAEFTRSDLLTRHKRTCGDNTHANRSRRKSCQACAESKVKCNLEHPCSKCTSRGRECVFINDPQMTRTKRLLAKRKAHLVSESSTSTSTTSESSCNSGTVSASFTSNSTYPTLNPLSPLTQLVSLPSSLPSSPPVPSLSFSPATSSTSSLHSSPRSEGLDNILDTVNLNFEGFSLENGLNQSSLGDEIFNSFVTQPFDSPCSMPKNIAPAPDFTGWLNTIGLEGTGTWPWSESSLSFSDCPEFSNFVPTDTTTTQQFSLLDTTSTSSDMNIELDHYLFLFFTEFCKQIPIIHPATWATVDKPPMLLRAMQACGALFVKTSAAASFIDDSLAMRDSLIQEFAKSSADPCEQKNLILTVVLLQAIGLFHQDPNQRTSSNVYHGMLVMMIRKSGLISRVGAWTASEVIDSQSLESTWRDWANYETIKRILYFSYLLDCYHCLYFSLSPCIQPSEMDLSLPCDDSLWSAADCQEWYLAAHMPSQFGIANDRLKGINMNHALEVISETRISPVPLSLNPFAHFILIHTILRNIYATQTDITNSSSEAARPKGSSPSEDAFATQYALHNWLQLWLSSPEAMQLEDLTSHPPFVYDPLPFYWLAQASLLAIQQDADNPLSKPDRRFSLITRWLEEIRTLSRGSGRMQTHLPLWSELMKIFTISTDAAYPEDHSNGLLSFFT